MTKERIHNGLKIIKQQLQHLFYFLLYVVTNSLVLIGEATKYIVLIPVRFVRWSAKHIVPWSKKSLAHMKQASKNSWHKVRTTSSQLTEKSTELIQKGSSTIEQLSTSVKENVEQKLSQRQHISNVSYTPLESDWFQIQRDDVTPPTLKETFFNNVSKAILAIQIFLFAYRRPIKNFKERIGSKILIPFKLVLKLMRFSVFTSFRYFYIGFFFCLVSIFIFQSYNFVMSLPSPRHIGITNYPLSTHIYDRNNRMLYEIYHDQNRTPIKLKDLPPYVYQASISIEDKDFYKHKGISIVSGVLRAIKESATSSDLQGGSTLTQQLVKTALLSPERTLMRKVKEAILAIWTEQMYTKNQILEMYLNQVPYGGASYGIEEASKTYFGKHAHDLTLAEAALLAGLPRAPSLYSPFVDPLMAEKRKDEVLKQMADQGYISQKQKKEAQDAHVATLPPKTTIKAPHFVFYIKDVLEKQYGQKQVEEGGMRVTTTLDLDVQQTAEQILKEELEKIRYLNVSNGAILVTQPSTGAILAMVGSVDYFASPSGAFNVTTNTRQPGSTIKVLTYSLALQKGYTAATVIPDVPTTFTIPGSPPYKPENYDGKFHGNVTLRYSLANSFNIPAVKTLQTIGPANFASYAQKLGIKTWNDPSRYGLSMTLGGLEVTMLDMTEAFGVFPNQGYRVEPSGILRLENSNGDVIGELNQPREKVVNEGVTYIISDILSDNISRQLEFGPHSALEIPGYKVAVKTGTTDWKRDNWTVGYTPEFLVAVWVGNNDNTPMNPYLASGITGAAPIWNRVMTYLLQNKSDKKPSSVWFTQPENVVLKNCGRQEYFLRGTENNMYCGGFFKPAADAQKPN